MIDVFEISDEVTDALTEALIYLSEQLQPFNQGQAGYGVQADLSTEGTAQRLRMHPFCWCEDMECPWCSCHLSVEEGYSNHQILQLEPIFEEKGFVPGEGAPNLHLESDGFELRIWWYKYIGRGMTADRHLTLEDVAAFKQRSLAILKERQADIYRASLNAELDTKETGLDDGVIGAMNDAFMALLMSAPAGVMRQNAIKRISNTIKGLRQTTYQATQATLAGEILDDNGVARYENPEDPKEFRMEFSLSHRLKSAMGGEDPQGVEIPF